MAALVPGKDSEGEAWEDDSHMQHWLSKMQSAMLDQAAQFHPDGGLSTSEDNRQTLAKIQVASFSGKAQLPQQTLAWRNFVQQSSILQAVPMTSFHFSSLQCRAFHLLKVKLGSVAAMMELYCVIQKDQAIHSMILSRCRKKNDCSSDTRFAWEQRSYL